MHSKLPKILTILFILFIVLQISSFLFLNLFYLPARAKAEWTMPDLQIKIPGMAEFTKPTPCPPPNQDKTCVPWIGEYIAGIYKYAIGIVGILATVVMMIGGILWIVAGGNATRVGEAKAWIGASLTGLVLALTSYTILYQINPQLTQFEPIKVATVEKIINGCCIANEKAYSPTTKKECDDKNGKWHKNKIKYTPLNTNKPEQCLTEAEIDNLKICCVEIINTGPSAGTYCAKKLPSDCKIDQSTPGHSIIKWGLDFCNSSECKSSTDCASLGEGKKCGDYKMCVGGICKICKRENESCNIGNTKCCTYLNLTCGGGGRCEAMPTIDCSDPANDGLSCHAEPGKKVCEGGTCRSCENDEGDWCVATPCCEEKTCCEIFGPNKCYVVCP